MAKRDLDRGVTDHRVGVVFVGQNRELVVATELGRSCDVVAEDTDPERLVGYGRGVGGGEHSLASWAACSADHGGVLAGRAVVVGRDEHRDGLLGSSVRRQAMDDEVGALRAPILPIDNFDLAKRVAPELRLSLGR